jgi:hypothetical protein
MIGIEKCKEILGENMSDSEVERLRESLYAMVDSILDNYFEELATLDICKKPSSTVESHLQSKAQRVTGSTVKNTVVENMRNKEVTTS